MVGGVRGIPQYSPSRLGILKSSGCLKSIRRTVADIFPEESWPLTPSDAFGSRKIRRLYIKILTVLISGWEV